jgi:hypothetical protein
MLMKMKFLTGMMVLAALAGGCSQFPQSPIRAESPECRSWKMKDKDHFDYFQYFNNSGRIVSLGYDENGDGQADAKIDLVAMESDPQYPHYVILLDGIPYDMVARMYQEGHFRLFYPPSKVVSPFPSMTDVSYTEMFMPGQLLGFESEYYNRGSNSLSDGNNVYLNGKNELWAQKIQYRVSKFLDAVGYVKPDFVFNHELSAIEKMMNRCTCGTAIGYTVGTSTVGTRQGSAGFEKCLLAVEKLCEKITYERKGRCRFTLMADHGHNLVDAQYFSVAGALKSQKVHVTKKLSKPGDVVVVEYGLVTNSAIYTNDPDDVAEVLVNQYDQVNLAVYPLMVDGKRQIVVRSRDGLAYVSRSGEGYRYEAQQGDPLTLLAIIDQLRQAGKVDKDGVIDDRALFDATVDHEYPDPLARVWRTFNGMVQYPADLLVTLNDGWFSGSRGFARSINVASTHGSLNRINTLAFVMSTTKPLPPAMRTIDVLENLKDRAAKIQ